MANIVQVLVGVSVIIGFVVMTAASFLLNQFRGDMPNSDQCKEIEAETNNICATSMATRGAGGLVIVAAIIQICLGLFIEIKFFLLKSTVSSMKKLMLVQYGVVFLLTNIGFAVGVHYYNKMPWSFMKNLGTLIDYSDDVSGTKSMFLFFNAMAAIDWIFCVGASVPTIIFRDD